jgi:hypothetical protein
MSDSHDRHGYPLGGFFVAHKRFMGHPFPPQGKWGDILDGPEVDDEAVIEAIIEAWADSEFSPDRDDLRVWHIVLGKEAEDCTAWAVKTVMEALELKAEGF